MHSLLSGMGYPSKITTLAFGDVAFTGRGPEGRPVRVGIEIKKLDDALGSMVTNRLSAHQLPGMLEAYEFIWVIVQGPFRPCRKSGAIQVPAFKGRWVDHRTGVTYRAFNRFLSGMEVQAGVRVRKTFDSEETAITIGDLYAWWSKEWDDHHLFRNFDETRPFLGLRTPTNVEEVASRIPGINWGKASMVGRRFQTPEDMMGATIQEWQSIPGIGKVLAHRAHSFLRSKFGY